MTQPISEFSLIDRFFKRQPKKSALSLGIGDDCALISVPQGCELAVTTDTMVENVHFFADCDPYDLGYKLLAVNLSDLAAMGAKPLAVTLALTLPASDKEWLQRFSEGFFTLADRHAADLIGGDTTSGPLTLTVQAFGTVSAGQALKRSGAKPGDYVCVSGQLGDAGLGLAIKQGRYGKPSARALNRFNRPDPRVDAGQGLIGIANACIDISDGIAGDLGHILRQSKAGACLNWDDIPLSDDVREYIAATGDWRMPLTAGDDYELCFTVSPENLEKLSIPHSIIGRIDTEPGLRICKDGIVQPLEAKSFEHFS